MLARLSLSQNTEDSSADEEKDYAYSKDRGNTPDEHHNQYEENAKENNFAQCAY